MTSKNPVVYLSKELWKYSKGNRPAVVLYACLFIIANLISFFEPLIVAKLLNTIQTQGIHAGNIMTLLGIVGLFFVIVVGFWIFHGPARWIEITNSFLVRANYRKHMIDGTMDLPLRWHTDHHSGDTIDKIEKGSKALYDFSGRSYELIETVVRLISSYLALVYFNLHSAYIVIFMMVMAFMVVIHYDKKLRKNYIKLNRAENKVAAKVYDIISNITTVVILRLEKLSSNDIMKKIMAPFKLFRGHIATSEFKWFLVGVFGSLILFFVLGSYILEAYLAGSTIMIGTLYALYGYVERIKSIFFRFAGRYGDLVRWRAQVENAEEISADFRKKAAMTPFSLKKPWKQLNINNLKFHYHGVEGDDLHLDNISLSFTRGERIALVGESGSGKTTFLKLLRGLYKPKKVRVQINGTSVAGFEALAQNITLIPQDPELFATTVRENITLGRSYSLKTVKKYTDMARFTQVANRLPKKFESSVVEKGVNLSTGEKQRLALARGLLDAEKRPILLLDEPTSSVDPKNEIEIHKNIFKAFKGKTIISSVHRLHLLPLFDEIYLFKQGKIVARGSLKDVLNTKEFGALWKKYKESHARHE